MIDYLIANMWQVWAVVAIVCLILELSSGDFFIICFSIGAVFALISAVLGLSIYWQVFIFALFTLLSVLFVRPVALRYLHKNDPNKLSNADALMGRTGRVTEEIKAGARLTVTFGKPSVRATLQLALPSVSSGAKALSSP